MGDPSKYWAQDETKKAVSGAIERVKRYQESLRTSGVLEKCQRSYLAYKGRGPRGDVDGSKFTAGGVQGEIIRVNVNNYAALVNQSKTLVTSNKPATKAVASNNDFESLAQSQLADAINEHYDRELNLSDIEEQCVLIMMLMGEGHEVLSWNPDAGRQIGGGEDESGSPMETRPQGDVEVKALTPVEVAYDPDIRDAAARQWFAFRTPCNRYDLMAQFPDLAPEIEAAQQSMSTQNMQGLDINGQDFFSAQKRRGLAPETDQVFVWEMRHIPTRACPEGRLIRFISESCVLFDSMATNPDGTTSNMGTPYKNLMVNSVAGEREAGTGDALTSFWDLMGLQEGIDLAASIMASAINAGGLQNMYVPRGANIAADRLTGALNVIQYDGETMPKVQENVAINPVIGEWIESQIRWARQRVGSNDVASGEPTKGMPAQAMALLRASAVEAHSGAQKAFERLIQRGRTSIIQLLQQFADTERVAMVAGKGNSWTMKYFTKDKLSSFDRFVMEPVNPAMKTLAGKVGFAQPLLDTGRISIDEYLQLVSTGRMDPILHAERDNYARIQQEKELLMQGIGLPPIAGVDPVTGQGMPEVDPLGLPVFAPGEKGREYVRPLLTDTHWIDIPEYLGVLSMPNMRSVPEVVRAVTQVVDLKLRMMRLMPPDLIAMLKGPVPAPPPMAAGGPSEMGGANGPDVAPPKQPKPPKNPITGEQDQSTQLS